MELDYPTFISRKRLTTPTTGFMVADGDLSPHLKPWQRLIVKWALRQGRAALFEECGLGKTFQLLEWAKHVTRHTRKPVLVLCPLAVSQQTRREAVKFEIHNPDQGIGVDVCGGQGHAAELQIGITNYEKLHLFDATAFGGVVLDESSVLKGFTSKTKQALCAAFAATPYKLCATATPAPNDRMELGNHAEFLGVMPSNEMLARWFINDTMKSGGYRLRRHGQRDFWRWVASWAVCIGKPSDLGPEFSDDGYVLPPLRVHEHVVESTSVPDGHLFNPGRNISATSVHQEKRACLAERAEVVANLVNGDATGDPWAIWCDTNYEADELRPRIPGSVEIRGSHPDHIKEDRLMGFVDGSFRSLITKSEIAGFGLNFQHCHKTTWFAGYSYERFYQAVRRFWRFGQQHPVDVHIVMSDAEESIKKTLDRKQREHAEMQSEMAELMREGMLESLYERKRLMPVKYTQPMKVPQWIKSKDAG